MPPLVLRDIGVADLRDALVRGLDDFKAMPSHAIFLCLIYPLIAWILGRLAFGLEVFPLFFPLAAGFALIGPFAALGLYELSRRREQGLAVSWRDAFGVLRSPALGGIAVLGALLMAIFLAWLGAARAVYELTFGGAVPASVSEFLSEVFTTPAGWTLLLVGGVIGLLFAILSLSLSVVSFPLLLDRDVGATAAMAASLRAVRLNPGVMAIWGLIVALSLALGAIPFFLGLAVVMPVLGHATWHLYRRVVEP